jgi:hypothetical protein
MYTILATQQVGDAIQDGVGFGGVRIGAVRHWGDSDCVMSMTVSGGRW